MSQIRVKGAKGAGLDACQRVVRAFRKAQPEQTVGDGDLFASNSVFVIVIIVIYSPFEPLKLPRLIDWLRTRA